MSKSKEEIQKEQGISVISAVYVENENNEVLFIQQPKFGGKWGLPGGHVNRNETLEKGALRELKEETGIKAKSAELVSTSEMIEPEDFHKKKHFICFEFTVKVNGRPKVNTNKEVTDTRWMKLEEAVKRDDLSLICHSSLVDFLEKGGLHKEDSYQEKWRRAQADYQNLKREMDAKKQEWLAWSKQQILEEFIPVYDNFKKAFAVEHVDLDKEQENWKKGIEFIKKQFGDILKGHNIEEIKTVGEEFNPELHEAVSEEESEEYGEGIIVKEVDPGYMMKGKIFKVAKVIVAKDGK